MALLSTLKNLRKNTTSEANLKLNSGFTLAEVLITLGIIGIIASITIPTVMNDINKAELKVRLKKEFAVIGQAYSQIILNNNGSLVGVYATNTGAESFKDALKSILKYTKDCKGATGFGGTGGGVSTEGCWHNVNNWYYLNGTARTNITSEPGLILEDGTLVRLNITDRDCNRVQGDYTSCGWIGIDINGFKKPNTIGKDIFEFEFNYNGILPCGARNFHDPATTCVEGSTDAANTGWGCAFKYLH